MDFSHVSSPKLDTQRQDVCNHSLSAVTQYKLDSPVVAVDEAAHDRKRVPKSAVLTFSPGNKISKLSGSNRVPSSPNANETAIPLTVPFRESSTLDERTRIAKEMCVV